MQGKRLEARQGSCLPEEGKSELLFESGYQGNLASGQQQPRIFSLRLGDR